jgi:hypothetical protein
MIQQSINIFFVRFVNKLIIIFTRRSNVNEEGVWLYRMGRVGEKLEEPDLNVILGK